jgi:hypothetical protein
MKTKLVEQMKKVYEKNEKLKEVLDEKSFSTFIETFEGEFEKIIKRRVSEEKRNLSEEFSKYNKSMQMTYEKNLAENIDKLINDIIKQTSKITIEKYIGLVDKYFNNIVMEKANALEKEIRKSIKMETRNKVNMIKESVKMNKYGFVVEELQSLMKKLKLAEDVNIVKDLKEMATRYNRTVKELKLEKRKNIKSEMNRIFNEAFNNYSNLQKINIKNMLKDTKFRSMSEFKAQIQIIKNGLKEGLLNADRKELKSKIFERNASRKSNLNEGIINNINQDNGMTEEEKMRKYLENYYRENFGKK